MSTRILIADDNALVRNALRQVLHEAGPWEVVEAVNGKEAVEKAREIQPDLVILDLLMPVMDGITATRQILQFLPEVPVLIHTLYWSPRIEMEALKAGVRKVVRKSESGVVVGAVQELLEPKPPPQAAAPPGRGSTIMVILNPENVGRSEKSRSTKPDEPETLGTKSRGA